MQAPVTLEQVAARAGCSVSTACRALTGNGPVSPKTVQRVRQAAAEIGYALAERRNGATRSRPVIGVLTPSITNPVFSASLGGIQHRLQAASQGMLLALSNYQPREEKAAVATLLAQNPLGLIITLCNPDRNDILHQNLPPTVLLNNLPQPGYPGSVCVDNLAAGRDITRFLLENGHSSILFVSGHFSSSDRALLRYRGYCDVVSSAGFQPLEALQVGFEYGYDNLDLIGVLERERPTAIIGSNDLVALGVLGALRRQGVSVPDDISVAGFDGIAIGRLIDRPLTSIEMPDVSMGTAAAAMLLDMIMNGASPRHLLLDYRLFPGATVRDIRRV